MHTPFNLLLAFATLVVSQTPTLDDSPPTICISLSKSTVCPAFHQFYVSTGVVDRYPFLPSNITTVQELDQSLLNYVNSTSDYLLPLGCLGTNYSPSPPYARYALTKMCARLIQDAEDSLPCNTEHNVIPPPLCRSTCLDWVHSITAITSQPQVCSDNSQRTTALANYTSHCLSWQGYNATTDQNCISGFANEPENCGFRDNIKEACEFCQDPTTVSNCCQMVTCVNLGNKGLSVPTIIGIALGGSATLVLIILIVYCFCWSKLLRQSSHNEQHHTSPPSTSSSTYLSDSKTAIQDNQSLPQHQQQQQLQQDSFKHWIEDSTTPTVVSLIKNTSATSLPSPISLQDDHHLQCPPQEDYFTVIHAYPPQMDDELGLNVGDIILMAFPFDDGWALGVNTATGLKGAFPVICVSRIEQSTITRCESTLTSSTIPQRMASKSSPSSSSLDCRSS